MLGDLVAALRVLLEEVVVAGVKGTSHPSDVVLRTSLRDQACLFRATDGLICNIGHRVTDLLRISFSEILLLRQCQQGVRDKGL